MYTAAEIAIAIAVIYFIVRFVLARMFPKDT